MPSPTPPVRTLQTEQELLDYTSRLAVRHHDESMALHLHLAQLESHYQKPDYIRIATETFLRRIADIDGKPFILGNHDIVLITHNVSQPMMEPIINRIRMLFSEDHIAHMADDEGPRFCSWYRLDRDYNQFLDLCRTLLDDAEAQLRHDEFIASIVVHPENKPLQPEHLTRLAVELHKVDPGQVIRKQTVCMIPPHQAPDALFDEIYISVTDLCTIIAPQLNLRSDRWLFQYLTQTLDIRMLDYLRNSGTQYARPFSLNLNIATLLGPAFARFSAAIATQLRKTMVLEFDKIDVFADFGAFVFARDYAHECGYRICLDGLNHLTLPYFDRTKLGFDLLKLTWGPDGIAHLRQEQIPQMRRMIMATDPSRVILCHCENAEAVHLGQELGIVMFQGREIDRMLASRPTKGVIR